MSAKDVNKMLANEVHADGETPYELSKSIQNRLTLLERQGQNFVVIVDEAQSMSDEVIEAIGLLTNFEVENKKLVQLIFVGEESFSKRLNTAKMRHLAAKINLSSRVSPIPHTDISKYLCHRLVNAGHENGHVFTVDAQRSMFEKSSGIPRLLNVIANRAMIIGYESGLNQIDSDVIEKACAHDLTLDNHSLLVTSDENKSYQVNFLEMALSGAVVVALAMIYLMVKII